MGNKKETSVFLRKAFVRFLAPAVLSSVALAVGALADCYFVGAQIGTDGLSIIGFGAPVYAFFSLISIGVSTGASIRYSLAMGEGDEAGGQEIFRNTLVFVFALLCVLSVAGIVLRSALMRFLGVTAGARIYPGMERYLTVTLASVPVMFMQAPFYYFVNSDGNPRLAAVALVSANIVDVLLNYVFVVVMKRGVLGSVYSTLLGAVVTIALCQFHVLSHKTMLRYGRLRIRPRILSRAMVTGFAGNAKYAYQFVAVLAFNHLMMRLSGESGVACLDITLTVSSLVFAVMEGVGLTLEPMISTFFAERNRKNIGVTLEYAFVFGGLLCCLLTVVLAVYAPSYCPLFGMNTPALAAGCTYAVRVYMLRIPAAFAIYVLTVFYQTTGRERISFVLVLLSEAACLLGFGAVFANYGFNAFWWCYLSSDLLTLGIYAVYYLTKRSGLLPSFEESVFSAFIRNGQNDLRDVIWRIQQFCTAQGASEKQSYFVTVAIEEVSHTIFLKNVHSDIYIQLTLVKESGADYVLHLRDNSHEDFSPFDVDTSRVFDEHEGENAIGMKLVKSISKEYLYRKYAGFNTLTVRL